MSFSNCVFTLLFLSSITQIQTLSLKPQEYRELVEGRCFNETSYHEPFIRGQWHPVGASFDYLAQLIEKIEKHFSDPKQVLAMILRRFHFDGTRHMGYRNFQTIVEINRRSVIERIFAKVPGTPDFPEDILFEDEKCAMFAMLSHTVNRTRPRRRVDPNNLFTGNEQIEDFLDSYPYREVGALSWANSDTVAISTAPFLLGLAVGYFRVANFSLSEKYPPVINPLVTVTFADRLALASVVSASDIQNLPLFGAEGRWNSSYCQTEYRLDFDQNRGANVTMADLNGGILGWSVGRKLLIEPDSSPLRKLQLSVLIRRFFSKHGIALDCGLCATELLTQDLREDIRDNARQYLIQWNSLYLSDSLDYERLISHVEYNALSFWPQIQKADSILQAECSRHLNQIYGSSDCETTSDIFIMLENSDLHHKFQFEFVKNILVRIQASEYLGRVTILVNALRGFDTDILSKLGADMRIPLHLLVYNTSSIQEATCRTAWYTWRETTIGDKRLLLEHLVSFFERHNITNPHPAVSRNFFWINLKRDAYKIHTETDRMLMHQYRWYLKYFLNLRTFYISGNSRETDDNDIIDILLNSDDRIQVNPTDLYDEQVIARLSKRICETPIPLIYENCQPGGRPSVWVNSSSRITPNKRQNWAVYPKLFLNSPVVRLKFRAENYKIRVCLNRYLRPEGDSSKCLEAKNDGDSVAFAIGHPCRWKRVDNCLPIYFTVKIINRGIVTPDNCLDDSCRALEQIPWEMSHSGLECTTGYHLYKRLSSVHSSASTTWMQRFTIALFISLWAPSLFLQLHQCC